MARCRLLHLAKIVLLLYKYLIDFHLDLEITSSLLFS